MRTSKYEIVQMMREFLSCEAGSLRSKEITKFVWNWKWVNDDKENRKVPKGAWSIILPPW